MGQYPLHMMIKPASGLCDMRCSYCFYCDEMENRENPSYGIMSESTIENIVRKTLRESAGECTFAFQGGEPTLAGLDFFRKVVELEDMYNTSGIRIHNAIQTNGYGINRQWAEFFAGNDFLVGVSVDGVRQTHDMYRKGPHGEGTYDRVLAATRLFDEYRAKYNILTVVNSVTAPRIRDIYKHYRENGWTYLQFIPCLDPLGEREGRGYSLTPEAYGRFLCALFDLWYADYRRKRAPFIRAFENTIGMMLGYPPESCDMRGVCGVQYVIEADGSVYPCDFYAMDGYRLGNINDDRIPALDRKRKEIGFIEASMPLPEACGECQYVQLCRNGCRRHRDGHMQTIFCHSYKMFYRHALGRMQGIAGALVNSR